jgi:superfamily II DNA/RNA helicase
VLSRGIDIDNIEIVVNYEVPKDAEDYVHRIGRTARAGASGLAITLINGYDVNAFADIERLIERSVEKPPLPDGLKDGPSYNPTDRRNGGRGRGGKGGGKRRFDNRKGGKKRPFNPKWKKRKNKGGGQGGNKPSSNQPSS